MASRRRQLMAALALSGVAIEAAWSTACVAPLKPPPWPVELLAEASHVFVGRVAAIEGGEVDRLGFAIVRLRVERDFKGGASGEVRVLLQQAFEPGSRLLVFAHALSSHDRQRHRQHRAALQRYRRGECSDLDGDDCIAGVTAWPEVDFPPLSAMELRRCVDHRLVIELRPDRIADEAQLLEKLDRAARAAGRST
jgi:hypothetical protein